MPNPNISTQGKTTCLHFLSDWYYHAPSKSSSNNEPLEPPPASQIPGLSNFIEEPDEMEERRFRRKWIRDSDSKYIKLAKGGGRQNLLSYKDPPPEQQAEVRYPRVDWFDHYNPEQAQGYTQPLPPVEFHKTKKIQPRTKPHRVLPEWYVHDQQQDVDEKQDLDDHTGQEYMYNKNKKTIVSFDNMSAWEREAKNEEADDGKRVKLPPIHNKKQMNNKPAKDLLSFPKRMVRATHTIDSNPVNFRHLLSMGYQKDWFEEQNNKYSDEKKKKQLERMKQEEKRSTQIRDAMEMRYVIIVSLSVT
ncbi:hypothetical protein QZH41_009994 [Actinostola sp. cb2023]|nr:hypothetical protein QZH41_009994 [Actinostola sp. cb2023]